MHTLTGLVIYKSSTNKLLVEKASPAEYEDHDARNNGLSQTKTQYARKSEDRLNEDEDIKPKGFERWVMARNRQTYPVKNTSPSGGDSDLTSSLTRTGREQSGGRYRTEFGSDTSGSISLDLDLAEAGQGIMNMHEGCQENINMHDSQQPDQHLSSHRCPICSKLMVKLI
jgi:hypothetical protein